MRPLEARRILLAEPPAGKGKLAPVSVNLYNLGRINIKSDTRRLESHDQEDHFF